MDTTTFSLADTEQEALHFTIGNRHAEIYGRIPCVVQIPFQEKLDAVCEDREQYNIALAEFGEHWLDSVFDNSKPTFIIGAGVEGMVKHPVLEKENYGWQETEKPLNIDFAEMEDPRSRFRMLSAIPLVMVLDRCQGNGRKHPRFFSELLEPEYENSIIYPDDGHMMDSILFTYLYQAGGIECVRKFKKNVLRGAHPSQMIMPGGIEEKPFIMLMPWVFAQIKAQQEHMELVWFEDGAPIIPIVITARDAERRQPDLCRVLLGAEIGKIFRRQGLFPSANPEINNELPGKLRFIGWDFLYRDDLIEIIQECKRIMLEERQEN